MVKCMIQYCHTREHLSEDRSIPPPQSNDLCIPRLFGTSRMNRIAGLDLDGEGDFFVAFREQGGSDQLPIDFHLVAIAAIRGRLETGR